MMGLGLAVLGSQEAFAASFTFTRIADTSGSFTGLSTPALNNNGTVAFSARLDTGERGIFTTDGTTLTTIADTSDIFSGFFGLALNDAGTVAFRADFDVPDPTGNNIGIFTGNGTNLTTVFTANSSTDSIGSPDINNAGIVAFDISLFQGRASAILIFNPQTGNLSELDYERGGFGNIAINDARNLAYIYIRPTVFELSTGNGSFFADANPFVDFLSNPAINNVGTAAFVAAANRIGLGVFTSNGSSFSLLVDSSGPFDFTSFSIPIAINDLGTVAFLTDLDAGGRGIFTGPNPVRDRVIATGDPLFGSIVERLSFFREGLNNNNQVAFFAQLADGTSGIFRADPAPKSVSEPGSVAGLAMFGLAFLAKKKFSKTA